MLKLLVVEDERLEREGLLTDIDWRTHGFTEVRSACSGYQALELLKTFEPDLILTDIMMMGMNGIEFIEKIRELRIVARVIVISGHDDFKYAQQAMRLGACAYLLKPVRKTELEKAVADAMDAYQRQRSLNNKYGEKPAAPGYVMTDMLSDLIYADFLDTGVLVARFMELGFRFIKGKYALAELSVERYRDRVDAFHLMDHPSELRDVCLLGERFSTDQLAVQGGLIREHDCLFLLSCDASMTDEWLDGQLESVAQQLVRLAAAEFGLPFQAGLSGVTHHLGHLRECFRRCEAALAKRFYAADGETVFRAERDTMNPMPRLDFEGIDGILSHAALLGDTEQIERTIDRMFGDLTEYALYDKAYVQGLCLNILARMQMTLCQVFPGGVPDLPGTSTLIAEMMEQPNIVELHRYLRERLLQMTACFTAMEDSGNLLYRELTAYVEKHFAEPLTLKNIAAELHYSPNYVGYVFQKKSSHGFNDYLITLRMNKALEMMRREPDRMVYEIAESVGYNSTSSFIKQFKNVFGKTPAELRKG